MRLDDTIRHADELQKKGMVYSEADWENRDKQKAVVNDENDQKPEFGKRFGTYPYRQMKGFGDIELAIEDITQGNYTRQCFILSAKDGWFDQ